MTTKLKSFFFSAYSHRRTHFDDPVLKPGESREADSWTEFRGVVLVPADAEWKAGEGDEPDWSQGGFLMEQRTLRRIPGWNFSGRPPEFFIEGWREGRLTDGVIICSDVGKQT